MPTINLPKSLRRFADKIEEVSDERGSGDGYWVYLKNGWNSGDVGDHTIHEGTITECRDAMKMVLKCEGSCCN